MFAIELTPETLPKITEALDFTEEELYMLKMYQDRKILWYFIRGYQTPTGGLEPWAILPCFVFINRFEYDPITIKTDFDLIVRKD